MPAVTLRFKQKPIQVGKIKVELIWFDSMGTKSSDQFMVRVRKEMNT